MTWAPLSIKNLTNALTGVADFEGLGIQLDIDYCELQKIFKDLPTTEERKRAVMHLWLESNVGASWEKLLTALQKLNLTRIARDIKSEYLLPSSLQTEGCSQSEYTSDDLLTTPAECRVQSSEMRVRLLRQEKDTLVCKYDNLVANAVETFSEQQEMSPKFFRKFRASVAVLPTSLKYQHQHFLKENSSHIAKTTTVEELFSILNSYCNFLNCSLLAHIINKFGNEVLKKELRTYTTALKEFRSRTKITDFSETCAEKSEIPPEFVTLKLRMGGKWEHCTLEDIEEQRRSLAQKSSVADYAIYFMEGVPGSLYLLWSIPHHAVYFFTSAMDPLFCNRHDIEEVTIDGEKVTFDEVFWGMYTLPEYEHLDEQLEGLLWTSGEGCLEDVVFFLGTGVEVNSRGQWRGRTALMLASEGGHLDVVKELLKAQADVNAQDEYGKTALMCASWNGHSDAAHILVSAGAQVDLQNKDGWTALMWASWEGHSDAVRILVSAGAHVDLQDEEGWTALMEASVNGHSDAARVLVSAGAQVDLQDENGLTALIYAVQWGHTGTVNELVKAGADVNLQENAGLTALIYAVGRGDTETVNVLVKAGAHVNLQDNTSGRSAIFYGAEKGYLEIVKLLIHAGATLSLKDKDGVTADEVAEVHGHQAVSDELRKYARVGCRPLGQDGVTADEVAEVHGHQAVSDELRKNAPVGRRPLSQAVRDRVLATSHLLRALYKRLEEMIFRTKKKELARRTQGLDPRVRDPQEHRL